MTPPKFADIGKLSSDLLGKDYPVGQTKLEVKTTVPNGASFTVNGSADGKTGAILGDLKCKFTDKARGLTVTESWTSTNILGGEVELADSLVNGLKFNLIGALLPASGQKNAKLAVEYKQAHLFTNAALDMFKGPTVSADAVIGAEGFALGGEVAYDVQSAKVVKFGSAAGYSTKDYTVALLAFNSFNSFSTSFYHRVSSDMEVGAKAVWDRKSVASAVAIELGSKYSLDRDAFVKAKVSSVGVVGLSLTQKLAAGIKGTIAAQIDTARLNDSAHKFGASLIYEA